MNIPCEKCGHPRPTEGIGDGEIAAVIRERDRYRELLQQMTDQLVARLGTNSDEWKTVAEARALLHA